MEYSVEATDEYQKYEVEDLVLGYIPKPGEWFTIDNKQRLDKLLGKNKWGVQFVKLHDGTKIKKAKPTGKKNNKIAIIIPNCNYSEWLEKCFNSIFNQTYKNYEIVFVDDMSTDNSVEIAYKLLKPPHKVIELKQKRYNGGARNEAYLHLSDDVDYVWYVDSDDWLKDEYVLEKINNELRYEPDVLFVGLDEQYSDRYEETYRPDYANRYEAFEGWSGSCGKVIKKELATRQECLYNEGTLKEDKNQHCRICIYMKSFLCLTESTYIWNHTNPKSVSTLREPIHWGTSTIRHYADTKELYLSVKGQDEKIDELFEKRMKKTWNEIISGRDRQF